MLPAQVGGYVGNEPVVLESKGGRRSSVAQSPVHPAPGGGGCRSRSAHEKTRIDGRAERFGRVDVTDLRARQPVIALPRMSQNLAGNCGFAERREHGVAASEQLD